MHAVFGTMRNKSAVPKRRGLSPAVTMLIILGISVLAGVAVFQSFQSQSAIAGTRASIAIENISLIKNPNGELWLSATIKNTGSKEIASSNLRLYIDTDSGASGIQPFVASPSPESIRPGQTSSLFEMVVDSSGDPIAGPDVGESVQAEIQGRTPDESVVATPATIIVSTA